MNIAIIGAGLAGLTLAQSLSPSHAVAVFEKARGPGGRMSTRRATPYAFDHGAQYFTAETQLFRDFLKPLEAAGLIATWPSAIQLEAGAKISSKAKYIAVPGMNAICKSLAADLDVRLGCEIQTVERSKDGWRLQAANGDTVGPFDWVISTAPAPQTERLFPASFAELEALKQVEMQGCFALMLGFEAPLDLPWRALKSGEPPIGWIALNSEKPGRESAYSLLIQSNNSWAQQHLEDASDAVKSTLLQAASDLAGTDLSCAPHQALHRWRYAATKTPAAKPFLMDGDLQIAACGDWCQGGKVEAAFLSAAALADALSA